MQLNFLRQAAKLNSKPTNLPMKSFKILLTLIVLGLILILAAVLLIYIAIGAVFVFGYFWW